ALGARRHRGVERGGARGVCRHSVVRPSRGSRTRVVTATTPAWLLQQETALCPCGCIGKRPKGSFVDRTLQQASGVLVKTISSEEAAQRSGFLQRCDARAKVVAGALLLAAVALVHDVRLLAALYALVLAIAVASRLGAKFFVQRVWLFVPIFTG